LARKIGDHQKDYGFRESIVSNQDCVRMRKLANQFKVYPRKCDLAITYNQGDIRLYLLICEAKRPESNDSSDYNKLIRAMHDAYNHMLRYLVSNGAELKEEFNDLKVLGLYVFGKIRF